MQLPSSLPAPAPAVLSALPQSWSALSWRQLCDVWQCKMQYGGNPDVARTAALLCLCGLEPVTGSRHHGIATGCYDDTTGEAVYTLQDGNGRLWSVTPRELSQMAKQALPWFPYPYGDPGKEVVKDEKGKVIEEAVAPVRGYVSPMRDALMLPEETVKVHVSRFISLGSRHFALPQVACHNLTWQQYRSLQGITPQLFADGISDGERLDLQAQFLAYCLVPRSLALLDTTGGSIRIRPHYTYKYDAERAEQSVGFWRRQLEPTPDGEPSGTAVFYRICFQCYQTALIYYASAYPLLFSDDGKKDVMKDALQGEVGTINAIMMKANYSSQQEVYDSNLPFILDILDTMTKEAKEIEAMNARIKRNK